ncbi:MAG: Trehalose import ATP-binding protein SugC [Phycisphaerae bacterium]|nr:Trehalose import ATP-binding protein SugC [Phycisphaerae bacterium]
MAEIILQQVSKVYPGGVQAVSNLDLAVADREFVVLVGPSGCGKSTTLRLIAGLEELSSGTIEFAGRQVNTLPPRDRDVAMVFQNYALYPHMTVYRNLAFGLLMRRQHAGWDYPWWWLLASAKYAQARAERHEVDRQVREVAEKLGISELLKRRPGALSGGQQQRVALGRALVRRPNVFLMDEPLSNLDAQMRVEMRAELKRLHRQFPITTIYVTHDQEEAMTLGQRVVVQRAGVVQQIGTPEDIYHQPLNRFVAGFFGSPAMNFLEGRLAKSGVEWTLVGDAYRWPISDSTAALLRHHADAPFLLGIRPEALMIDNAANRETARTETPGFLKGEVELIERLGERIDVHLVTGAGQRLICRAPGQSTVLEGENVTLAVDLRRIHYFDQQNEQKRITNGV